jgi:hypothetical protein
LSKAVELSLRPLRPEVALVLAWPALQRVTHDSAGATVGLDSSANAQDEGGTFTPLGFNVVRLLLGDVHRRLSRALAPPKSPFGNMVGALAAARQAKSAASGGGGGGGGGGSVLGGSGPASGGHGAAASASGGGGGSSSGSGSSDDGGGGGDGDALLALYLRGGVLKSCHGLLGRLELALVDDLHDADETYARETCMATGADDEGHPDAWPCFELLLRTVL